MKILYVEDNAQDAELARVTLARSTLRAEVTTVPSVAQALAALVEPAAFDLVLSDVHLPDGSGLEILRHVRERALSLAVVLITGAGDDETALGAMRAGADDYIVKHEGYLDRLARVLDLARQRQRESAQRRSRPLRVLYADPNAHDVDLTQRHFARAAAHLPLEVVPTGGAVLARLDKQATDGAVDVLLLDYQLPGWNALDLIKELLQVRGMDLPIIVVTGHGGEELVTQCLRLGASDYVLKAPGYVERLPITIENAWFRAQQRRDRAALLRLAAFPEHSPNPVFELTADARVTYHNAAARELASALGLSQPQQLLPGDVAAQVETCLRTGVAIRQREVSCGEHVLAWSYAPVSSQSVVHCYAEDVTQRHELEQRLRQSQKMEAVGRLAGGVAHDFNNLLMVIEGNLHGLRAGAAAGPRESLDEISLAVERAAGLTRQLLAFSRRSPMQRVRVDLNDVVSQVVKLLRRTLGERVALVLELAPEPMLVTGDPSTLEQVVMNLVLNARDAMPEGGTLAVRTQLEDAPPSDAPELAGEPQRFVRLSVQDDGTGIAREIMPRIFEPFFTTKGVGKGTGLGLSTVQGIVQQHGGYVRVRSELGHGTLIETLIPALTARPSDRPKPTMRSKADHPGHETILVVEDEAAVRTLVCRALEREGYQIHAAANGSEAIVRQAALGHIDLVLTDLLMPGELNGLQLIQHLRAVQPRLPVVFTSGYEAQVLGPSFTSSALESFLAKPYELSRLCQVVREALDRAAS